MQARRWRGNVFQIAEDAAGVEQPVNFRIKRALTVVPDVMNGKAGYDRIKLAKRGQRLVEVVGDDCDGGISGEALGSGFQHGGREVDRHRIYATSVLARI